MKTLRQIREERGVSKSSLCEFLGVSIADYDSFEARPDLLEIEIAKRIAEHLGVSIDEIFFVPEGN